MSSKQILNYILMGLIAVGAIFIVIRLVKLISSGEFWGLIVAVVVTFILLIIYGRTKQN